MELSRGEMMIEIGEWSEGRVWTPWTVKERTRDGAFVKPRSIMEDDE
jgi:hypothetical protein